MSLVTNNQLMKSAAAPAAAKWGGGVRTDGGPGAKPPENILGPRPSELWETPLLKIEIRPFEYRDTPFFG